MEGRASRQRNSFAVSVAEVGDSFSRRAKISKIHFVPFNSPLQGRVLGSDESAEQRGVSEKVHVLSSCQQR